MFSAFKKLSNPLKIVLIFILLFLTFAGGVVVGQNYLPSNLLGKNNLSPEKDFILKNQTAPNTIEVDFGIFWQIWQTLNQKHIYAPLNQEEMLYGAIRGAIEAIDDPYTAFLAPDTNKTSNENMEGEFGGVGIQIEKKEKNITVISVLPDGPASETDLKAGDIITKVDETPTNDLNIMEVVANIRGEEGTKVDLEIKREKPELKVFTITVKRETIKIPSIKIEIDKNKIAHLEIVRFGSDWQTLLQESLELINEKKPTALIVDLRNNAGGLLSTAIELTSVFLEKEAIIARKESPEEGQNVIITEKEGALSKIPLYILINKGSASASEIMAAAVKENERGILIGETSFGKGTIQDVANFKDGSSLRITVAKWLTPKENWINEVGVAPDINVEDDPETKEDEVLQKTEELIIQNTTRDDLQKLPSPTITVTLNPDILLENLATPTVTVESEN